MDAGTVTFVAGLISCVIGVSTFISGRMTKAERNGSMETKINQALEGITAINHKLEVSSHDQHAVELMVRSHEEQLKTCSAMTRIYEPPSKRATKLVRYSLSYCKL